MSTYSDSLLLKNEKVCQSIDIRKRSHLIQLDNCTVIEGDLYIVMVTLSPKQSFPLLKEITGSLVIYYVSGIKTLESYFPNLTVIRGQTLAYNYAIVIKETNLLYLGLLNLRVILFGGIRIDNNPSLCYISRINWQSIIKQSGAPVKMVLTRNICPDFCPKNCSQKSQEEFCWSHKSCQSVCSQACISKNVYCSMNDSNLCCHSECLGGCYGEGNDKCVSCKNVLSEGRCVQKCQESFYKYKNRRCISKQECAKLSSPSSTDYRRRDFYAIEDDSCVKQCSSGKERDEKSGHCVVCGYNCSKKYCGKVLIHSINDLISDVDGCYSIEEIYISIKEGGPTLSEILTKSFSKLRVIENSLKIVRSSSIKSLSFLSPLRLIKGNLAKKSQKNGKIDNVNKSFVFEVYDNENLVEISNEKSTKEQFNITILQGSVTFTLNRQLCPEKILKFIKTNIHSPTELSVLEENIINVSNGDMAFCKPEKLNVTILSILDSAVSVICNSKIMDVLLQDSGAILTFMLKETEKNVSQHELSTTCSDPSWRQIIGHLGKQITINELKPSKRYVLYVEAYRSKVDNWLVNSDVIYFTTKTKSPSPPRNVKTVSLSDSEIKLTWNPPLFPNGKVTKYIIRYRSLEIHHKEFMQNNLCTSESHSRIHRTQSKIKMPSEKDSSGNSNTTFCDCNSCMALCNQNLQNKQDDEDSEFHMLDHFISQIFRKQNVIPESIWDIKNSEGVDIPQILNNSNIVVDTSTFSPPEISSKKNWSSIYNISSQPLKMVTVSADIHFHIFSNLHHYTEYLFEIQACQQPIDDPKKPHTTDYQIKDLAHSWINLCSLSSSTMGNTLSKDGVDNINEMTIKSFVVGNSVKITWQEPMLPNGLILNFLLRYREFSPEKIHDWLAESCITRLEWLNEKNLIFNTSDSVNNTLTVSKRLSNDQQSGSFILKNLDPGNYEFQIKPISIPSNGSWTKSLKFIIPQNSIFKIYRTLFIVGSFLIILFVLIAIGLMYYYYRKRYLAKTKWVSSNPDYWIIYEIDEWEIDRKDVDMIEWNHPLGRGSFGMVYKGILRKLTTPAKAQFTDSFHIKDLYVAVKTLNANSTILERREFINEACYMKQFQSYHLVKLFGVVSKINFSHTKKHKFSKKFFCSKFPFISRMRYSVRRCFANGINIFKITKSPNREQPGGQIDDICSTNKISFKTTISQHFQKMPLVVMELMEYGDLAGYLRKQGEEGEGVISEEQSYLWALQIADGMLYLSEMKFVHRDLAARNCMINNLLIIKIGDFGMARDIYYDCYYRKEGRGRLPVRWMAPEALKSAYFTTSSDVWSFGVILWEISTLSSLPYRGMSHHDVIQFVTNGGTLLNNGFSSFPKLILNVMDNCWKYNPEDRFTFYEICQKLELHSDQNFQQNSHYFNQKYYDSQSKDILLDIYLNSENYIDNSIPNS